MENQYATRWVTYKFRLTSYQLPCLNESFSFGIGGHFQQNRPKYDLVQSLPNLFSADYLTDEFSSGFQV